MAQKRPTSMSLLIKNRINKELLHNQQKCIINFIKYLRATENYFSLKLIWRHYVFLNLMYHIIIYKRFSNYLQNWPTTTHDT